METPSAERIRQIRNSLNLSQYEFAEIVGTRSDRISTWELDKARPRKFQHIRKLIELDTQLTEREQSMYRTMEEISEQALRDRTANSDCGQIFILGPAEREMK